MTSVSRRSVRVAGLTVLAVAMLVVPSTSVAAGPVAADEVVCSGDSARAIPGSHAETDSSDLNALERSRTAFEQTRKITRTNARAAAGELPTTVLVPVYVHVIQGSHLGERRVTGQKVRRVMEILRAAYRGDQSATYGYQTRFSFTIKKIDFTRSDRWYHAGMNSAADQQMKRSLHKAGARSLNLYINEPGGAQGLLGFARFPWQYEGRPYLDGVTVHVDSLPYGAFGRYNLGDTVVHEVGHWLGLFHTFQSSTFDGCDATNDGVADTPAEKDANGFRPDLCDNPANVCDITDLTDAGLRDPVFNFMDYSVDRCMREFTQGQSERMDFEYSLYRAT